MAWSCFNCGLITADNLAGDRRKDVEVRLGKVKVFCGDVIGIVRSLGGIAAGNVASTCRAIHRGQVMMVEHATGGQPVAWFRATRKHITTSPSDNQWASGVANYLCMIRL